MIRNAIEKRAYKGFVYRPLFMNWIAKKSSITGILFIISKYMIYILLCMCIVFHLKLLSNLAGYGMKSLYMYLARIVIKLALWQINYKLSSALHQSSLITCTLDTQQ